jgi:putative methyltransferase (TIGR04325 family)
MKRLIRKVLLPLGLDVVPTQHGNLYSSFEDAARKALELGSNYNSSKTACCVVESTAKYRDNIRSLLRDAISPMLSRRLFALQLCAPRGAFHVLDFGGAAGQHYYEAEAFFSTQVDLRWHVVDTEEMVSAARVLESQSLKFFSSLDDALIGFEPDLVFSSGTLQCLPNPLTELQRLTEVRSEYLFLTRGAYCSTAPHRYIVETSSLADQGPLRMPKFSSLKAAYPLSISPLSQSEGVLSNTYEIIYRFAESDLLGNLIGKERAVRMGHFCRLKKSV